MKKIINGKRYDTSTAILIGSARYSHGDLEYLTEELYRKKTGEFFLYRITRQNKWPGGEEIRPASVAGTPDQLSRFRIVSFAVDDFFQFAKPPI